VSEVTLMNLSMMNGFTAKVDGVETKRATILNMKNLKSRVSKNAAWLSSERVSHQQSHDRSAGNYLWQISRVGEKSRVHFLFVISKQKGSIHSPPSQWSSLSLHPSLR